MHTVMCTLIHTKGQFRVVNPPSDMILGGWRKLESPGETEMSNGEAISSDTIQIICWMVSIPLEQVHGGRSDISIEQGVSQLLALQVLPISLHAEMLREELWGLGVKGKLSIT